MKDSILTLVAAAVGGVIGYFAFFWVVQQGYYGLIIPGGCLGFAASLPKNHSKSIAYICGVLALGLGIFTEWKFAPFKADNSFSFFMTHLHNLKPVTLIMIVVGGCLGFWLPFQKVEPVMQAESE